MVAGPAISSMRVLCGAPRTLIEHSMRKHMPSSVEELVRICGEFVGAGPFSFGTSVCPGLIKTQRIAHATGGPGVRLAVASPCAPVKSPRTKLVHFCADA